MQGGTPLFALQELADWEKGIRSPRLCFGCAWQAGGSRVEGGRQAAAKLAVVSHDQAVGKSALAIL
ncbi:MAG TPA: hypothetical protein VN860_01985, partial [Candidatus Acidoferrales bacterium]|nr:hypothetical protein [Candidatus Acidoferrales bacterium]